MTKKWKKRENEKNNGTGLKKERVYIYADQKTPQDIFDSAGGFLIRLQCVDKCSE